MRNSISHTKNDFEGIRSHNPTKLLCLSPKICGTREITSLTGTSSHEELNRPGRDVLAQNLQPLPWDDSASYDACYGNNISSNTFSVICFCWNTKHNPFSTQKQI